MKLKIGDKTMVTKDVIIECGICNTEIIAPNVKVTPPRPVKYFEIELILTATGETYLNENTYKLKPTSIVLAKPGQTRRSKTHFKCYYMHYILDEKSKYYDLLMNCPDFYYLIDGKRYLKIYEDLFHYLNILNMKPTSDLVQAKATELFFFLLKDAEINRDYSMLTFQSSQAMMNILTYIEEHYSEKLTLEHLANVAGYSKNHFARLFKQVFKISPQKYIETLRIDIAKKMLLDSNNTLTQIAYDVGFPSQSYLNYIFKKYMRVTPLDYRKFQLRIF